MNIQERKKDFLEKNLHLSKEDWEKRLKNVEGGMESLKKYLDEIEGEQEKSIDISKVRTIKDFQKLINQTEKLDKKEKRQEQYNWLKEKKKAIKNKIKEVKNGENKKK